MHLNFIQSWVQFAECGQYLHVLCFYGDNIKLYSKFVSLNLFVFSLFPFLITVAMFCPLILPSSLGNGCSIRFSAGWSSKTISSTLYGHCNTDLQRHLQVWPHDILIFCLLFIFIVKYHVEVHQKDLCILGCVYRVLFTHSKVPVGCRVTFDVLHRNPSLKLVAKFLHQCLSEKFNFNESLLDGYKIKVECTLFCRYSEAATRTGPNWKERLLYTM